MCDCLIPLTHLASFGVAMLIFIVPSLGAFLFFAWLIDRAKGGT